MRSARRRFALRREIIICLVFGAVGNVLFGWSGAIYQYDPLTESASGSLDWPVRVPDGWKAQPARYTANSTTINTTSIEANSFFAAPLDDPEVNMPTRYHENRVLVLRCGFPMRSMSMRIERETAKAVIAGFGKYPRDEVTERITPSLPIPGFLKSESTHETGRLPLTPLWIGFTVNTLLYGGLLYLLVGVPGIVRRSARRRHGRCPICAYNLAGLGGCPECGHGQD